MPPKALPIRNAAGISWAEGDDRPCGPAARRIEERPMAQKDKIAILAGGGPAPGINSVISAATIQARQDDLEVLGIQDGFSWIMKGDIEHVVPLTIEGVSRP